MCRVWERGQIYMWHMPEEANGSGADLSHVLQAEFGRMDTPKMYKDRGDGEADNWLVVPRIGAEMSKKSEV